MAYDPLTSGIPALSAAQDAALPTFLPEFGAPDDIPSLRDRLQDLWDRVAIMIANAQGTEYRYPERFVWETLERLNIFRMTHGSVLPTPAAIGHLHGDYSQEEFPLRPLVWDGENWVNFHVSGLPDERMLDVILRPVMVAIAAMNPPAVQAVNALRTELRGNVAEGRNTLEKLSDALDELVGGAPAALNTLQELAAALGDDENFAASVVGMLTGKQDTLTGSTGVIDPETGVARPIVPADLPVARRTAASVSALAALPSPAAGEVFTVAGRAAILDGGEGEFVFDAASSAAANGATVVSPAVGGGRYLRLHSRSEILADWFALAANGTDDDRAVLMDAIDDAVTRKRTLRCPVDAVYGVSAPIVVPGRLFMDRLRLKDLNPTASTSRRLLQSIGQSGHRWSNVRVDLGTAAASFGSIEDYRPFYIEGGDDHVFENCEVAGHALCSAMTLYQCVDSVLRRPFVHDIQYSLASSPGDDVINGILITGGENITLESPRVRDLGGNFGAGAAPRFSRGITGNGGVKNLKVLNPAVFRVDQGVDFTGSEGVDGGLVSGGEFRECNSYSVKVANSPDQIIVENNRSYRAGLVHYVVNGIPSDTIFASDIIFRNNFAISINAASTFAGSTNRAYFAVWTQGSPLGDPRNVYFENNFGFAPAGDPAPQFGFYCDVPASDARGTITFDGGRLEGWTTAMYGGGHAGPLMAEANIPAPVSIPHDTQTVIPFVTVSDVHGMHSAGVFKARRTGPHAFDVSLHWDNATGNTERQLILRKGETNTARRDIRQSAEISSGQTNNLAGRIHLVRGETISFVGLQKTGSALNIASGGSYARVAFAG